MLMLLLQPNQSLFPCWGIFVPERAGAETVTDFKLNWQKLLENFIFCGNKNSRIHKFTRLGPPTKNVHRTMDKKNIGPSKKYVRKSILPYVYGMFACHSCLLRAHGGTVDVLAVVRGGHCGPVFLQFGRYRCLLDSLCDSHEKLFVSSTPSCCFDTARPVSF